MRYRFVREVVDYSDLASGAVLHSLPGRPAFPVRLSSELFQRAYRLWLDGAEPRPCALHDPCCGTGYLLTVVTLLHGDVVRTVVGSDEDRDVLRVAERNLALLTPSGMRSRIDALAEHVRRFGKASHLLALRSAERLLRHVEEHSATGPISTRVFHADALDTGRLAAGLGGTRVDIVLTDTPYGSATTWAAAGPDEPGSIVARMLSSLRPALGPGAVVVVVVPRGVRAEPSGYRRVQRVKAGRREALFWRVG